MSIDEMAIHHGSVGDVDSATDRLLVERSQNGDREAFAQLYVWYSERIARYCRLRLSDTADAEDAAQEVFVRAWRSLGTFSGDRHFYPWLQVIAHNVCVDWNRRRRPALFSEDQLVQLAASIPASDERVLTALDSEQAVAALHNLAPRYREVLELREERSWSYQQIADQNGVPISTIETLLFRARRALRKEFAALAGGDGALALGLMRLRSRVRHLIAPHLARAANSSPAWEVATRSVAIGGAIATITIVGVMAIRPVDHLAPQLQSSASNRLTALAPRSAGSDKANNVRRNHAGQDPRTSSTGASTAREPNLGATTSGATGALTSALQDRTAAIAMRAGGGASTVVQNSTDSLTKAVVSKTRLVSKGLGAAAQHAPLKIRDGVLTDKKAVSSAVQRTAQMAKNARSLATSAADGDARAVTGLVTDDTTPAQPAGTPVVQGALATGTSSVATVAAPVASATSEVGSAIAKAAGGLGSVGVSTPGASTDARNTVNVSAKVPT